MFTRRGFKPKRGQCPIVGLQQQRSCAAFVFVFCPTFPLCCTGTLLWAGIRWPRWICSCYTQHEGNLGVPPLPPSLPSPPPNRVHLTLSTFCMPTTRPRGCSQTMSANFTSNHQLLTQQGNLEGVQNTSLTMINFSSTCNEDHNQVCTARTIKAAF